ncbi:helix-turn-helix domain-containing protein [Nocardioides exalbidus]|uniref:helix-turn-helix domain-containing protein n=1 Tax=Nocardioides exalbidus TaxID=402596 RepID=UPI0015873636|nr:helix-turn-helix domain-containing protein [Nocardioides exalbidus]
MNRTGPGPADHLGAYVDRATASEVDPASDPEAARVRVAMAGESAPRFRDRLVLERAAWLARHTDRRLQDISVECGFRGYDVFVRAFRRELGASPSEWRANPTTWEIDAPGEVHFHPPDGIRLPARTPHDDTVPVAAAYVDAFSPHPTVAPLGAG